jgi:hypothetical protein
MCDLTVDQCSELAYHLVASRRDGEATKALKRVVDGEYRLVGGDSWFLTRYYHDRGQRDAATNVAQGAAATGTLAGLTAEALLLEWRRDLAEAEEHYIEIERKFANPDPLVGFYFRMAKEGRSDFRPKFESRIRSRFPGGLEKLDPDALPPMPRDGVRLSNPTADAELCGLEMGDIVVGVDGWRIHDQDQYLTIVDFDWRPDLTLHIWRKGGYKEIPVHVMGRHLPLDIESYPAAPPPG